MEQQWEEFECMRSMFPAHDELQFDAELMNAYEHHVLTSGPRPDARLQYTIRYKVRHCKAMTLRYIFCIRNIYFCIRESLFM